MLPVYFVLIKYIDSSQTHQILIIISNARLLSWRSTQHYQLELLNLTRWPNGRYRQAGSGPELRNLFLGESKIISDSDHGSVISKDDFIKYI